MDCWQATQGTELDPAFKGDWTTRAVGVACSLDDVVRAAISSALPDGDPVDRILRAQRHQESASVDTVADDFVRIYARALGHPVPTDSQVIDLRSASEDRAAIR